MSWMAAAVLGSAAITAGTSIYSSNRASQNANNAASLADPFAGNRQRSGQMLFDNWDTLTGFSGQDILQDPEFQFLKKMGLGAMNSNMAASGRYNSGQRGAEAGRLTAGYATQAADKIWQRKQQILQALLGMSGATTGNPGQAGTIYGQGQNAALSVFNRGIGNSLGMLGNINWGGPAGTGPNTGSTGTGSDQPIWA